MKCLVLAAGYATRLYPLTENFPKPLLKVKDKAILDWLIDDLAGTSLIDEFVVISNHKFAGHFKAWAKEKPQKIIVVDDMTDSNETRLGAVKDILFAIEKLDIDDDILVIAGDNVLDFSLSGFLSYAKKKNSSCVMRYFEPSEEKLKKCGVLSVDEHDRVLFMEEKPSEPKSNWCCPPFYFYKREDAGLIGEGIKRGCGTDAPGSFVCWIAKRRPVYAMEMPGARFDIGNLESYKKVQETFKGIIK